MAHNKSNLEARKLALDAITALHAVNVGIFAQ